MIRPLIIVSFVFTVAAACVTENCDGDTNPTLRDTAFQITAGPSAFHKPKSLLASSRFWGKRAFTPDQLRKSSIRWGKRSDTLQQLMPGGDFMFPIPMVSMDRFEEEHSQPKFRADEMLQRVTKGDDLRTKLGLSSRLWGR